MWFKSASIRLAWELFKILPLLLVIAVTMYYLGDDSQLKLVIYFTTGIAFNLLIFQVIRKFMFPSLSVESHMKTVLEDKNIASAILVIGILLFQLALAYMNTLYMVASIRAPL